MQLHSFLSSFISSKMLSDTLRAHVKQCGQFSALAAVCFSLGGCESADKAGPAGPHIPMPVYTSPLLGSNVLVFDPSMNPHAMQQKLDRLHDQQAYSEFSNKRYALLFKPGEYDLTVNVDYFVQAAGLGLTPGEVVINGAVQSKVSTEGNKVTTMFWRAAENFLVKPDSEPMYWAVSQAAPYRRMHIQGDVQFDKGSWASGGVLANSVVEGTAGLTTGQQWFTRNAEIEQWKGGNWNRVFVGTQGSPKADWPATPTTVIPETPVVRDKPFLTFRDDRYSVFVPALQRNSRGVSWRAQPSSGASSAEAPSRFQEPGELIGLEAFYIAKPGKDTAQSLNAALAQGKHLLFTPGLYELDAPVNVTQPNTVVLGLGLATLIPQTGLPAMTVANVPGVKIAGLMFDAGILQSSVLLQIGEQGSRRGYPDNPISLNDVFCRVGGAIAGQAEVCVEINSHYVVADHFWLWRADHGVGADWEVNRSAHGLVVNGDDVTIYGLFNEHFQHYQTLWKGERGRTYFYQSEIPYKPPSIEAWNDQGDAGFASYKVADDVNDHHAWGLGIYSFFRGEPTVSNGVRLENSMVVPNKPGIHITHISNFAGLFGGINHVINGEGRNTEVGELTLHEGLNPVDATPSQ